ncbi:MAG: hypothetical protein H7343_14790 [Undibacterium sp.]|nr:hypothetical protein [Opitutaceae bacterium]
MMVFPSSPSGALPLCILIPAGPGEAEIARVTDLMDACAAYADLPLSVVVINDGNDDARLALAGRTRRIPTTVRPNARRGAGDWWCGGLDMAMIEALLWIARHHPCCGVLRLDSDALVINPYARTITGLFERDGSVGMMGNFDSPTGAPIPPGHRHTAMLYWRSKPVSYEREQRKLIFSFWGWRLKMRRLIGRARAHGYVLGDSCQGGGYALSPEFLRRLAADPFFARPRDFIRFDVCEDVVIALAVHALGLRIHYTTGPARLFASKWKGLIAAPESLAAAGQGIIHSVKDHAGRSETDIRAFFAARRSLL